MKNILLFIFVLLVVFSCKSNSSDKGFDFAGNESADLVIAEEAVGDVAITEHRPPNKELTNRQKPIDKKIIKEGALRFKVIELEKAKQRIDSILKIYKGYYSKELLRTADYESTYYLRARIPNKNFEAFVEEVEACDGEITSKDINARDVTEQFVDLETRLENKKSYLERYRQLLSKAKTIKEILEIEEIIRGLEEEIESTTGRLKYLVDQVDFSSLEITLTKKNEYKYKPRKRDSFGERLKKSLSKGWFGLLDFILALLRIWPFWIILAVGIFFWRRFREQKKKNS